MAKKSKLNLINDDLTWNADRRYKVNSVVQLNGEDYQNITGKNSNPELLIDWQKIYTDIAISDVTGLPTALDDLQLNKEDKSNKNIANGYAGLDSSGKINPIQLPTLAITETFVVGSESAMLSLVAEVGDVAVRTDLNKSFILRVTGASTLANWQELLSPTSVDQTIIDGSTNAVSGNAVFDALDLKLNISDLPTNLTGYELKSNKQNSLSVDGTGVKYVTVDAVNTNVVNKADTEGIRLDNTITPIYAWGDSLTGGAGQVPYPTALQSQTFFSVTNKGYPSESSTQIKDRMLSEPSNYSKSVVIWIGRNNYNAPNIVKADIATMVSALGHTRYLIVGIINGDYATEYAGQAGWLVINQLNADLKALYGKRFVDIRPYLVSLKTNSAQDLIDFANDVPPASLRIDPLHLTSLGYEKVSSFINKSLGILYQNEAYFQSKDFKYYFESNLPLHTFGNETKTGILTFSNSGTTQINGLVLNNTGTTSTANSIYVNNSSSGRGIYTLNTSTGQGHVLDNFSTGQGLFVNNILTGRGISVDNTSTGRGITAQNTSTGRGFSSDNSAGGQGFYSNNTSTGFGIYSANASTGRGISNDNNSTGFGYYSNNASTGIGMFLNSKTDSTGDILQFAKNGTVTSKFDQNGILTSPSPILTGIPVAPTATAGANTTQVATTAFVTNGIATADSQNVKLTGNQTVLGVKTFSSSPIVPTAVNANEAVNKGQLDAVFDGLALKSNIGHTHVASQITDLSKASVGLGNVDNTSDLSKPLSTATINALATKFPTPTGLTTNYLPKWNGSGFGNSGVFDNGTNVGIGTATPIAKLHIDVASSSGSSGSDGFRIASGLMGLNLGTDSTNNYSWISSSLGGVGSRALVLQPVGGRVLINKTDDDLTNQLQVAGTITASPATTANQVPTWGQVQAFVPSGTVNLTGAQTVAGVKTFSDALIGTTANFSGTVTVPNPINPFNAATKQYVDAAASSGTYTPTFSNLVNVGAVNITNAVYTKVGNIIQGRCTAVISTIAIGLDTSFDFSLPQARNSQTNIFLCGSGARFHNTIVNGITYIQSINTGRFIFKASGSIGSSDIVTFNFQYDITQ